MSDTTDSLDDFDVRTSRNDEVRVQLKDDWAYLDHEDALSLADWIRTTAHESRSEDDL